MKIGDKVRFLSDVGGGIVAGFQGNNIVLVEDEDGFQMPTPINDVVVVGEDDYSTKHLVENKQKAAKGPTFATEDKESEPADRPVTFKAPVEERQGGNLLNAYLAFVPIDPHAITSTRFETYFVNDSNYYMRFVYMTADGANWSLRATAEVEPNTKLFIEEFGRDELNGMERVCVQLLAYKKDKTFMMKPVVDVQLRIDTVKFYKLHTFQENDFFEQNALLYAIVESDKPARTIVIEPDKIKEQLMGKAKTDMQPARKQQKKESKEEQVVVDLHANELLDTTAGMSHTDILNYQLDVFRRTLKDYEKKKGQKIVFIHGKGDGVLRKAITDELRYHYKQYTFQDASFREYGFGATQVTIR